MEALIIAALLYLAGQSGVKADDVVAERFGAAAGEAVGRLLDAVRSRVRADDRSRQVLERFEARPRDLAQFRELRRQVNALRVRDEDFDRLLTELTGEVQVASGELWEALRQAGHEVEQGLEPVVLGLSRAAADAGDLRLRLAGFAEGLPDAQAELRSLTERLIRALDAYPH